MSSTPSRPTYKVKPSGPTNLGAFDDLLPRQQRFVEAYLIDHNASRAARAAGNSATGGADAVTESGVVCWVGGKNSPA